MVASGVPQQLMLNIINFNEHFPQLCNKLSVPQFTATGRPEAELHIMKILLRNISNLNSTIISTILLVSLMAFLYFTSNKHVVKPQLVYAPLNTGYAEKPNTHVTNNVEKPHGVGTKNCYPNRGLRPLKDRKEMGILLEEHGLKTGAEVGVQTGTYSDIVLSKWKSCQSYKLIDAWIHTVGATPDEKTGDLILGMTKRLLRKYQNITEYFRMTSHEAAKKIEHSSLDFIYIDARHDYCGVKEDLEDYWPLLIPGGIMAGHDYLTAEEVPSGTIFGPCDDGTPNQGKGAVRGAVEDFMLAKGLTITVTYWKQDSWFTWLVQKPIQC